MPNQPDQDTKELREPSGRLVLPPPPGDEGPSSQGYTAPVRPEQLLRRPAAPGAPGYLSSRLTTFWQKDPAYRILLLGIALVIVASIVFVVLGASALSGGNNSSAWSNAYTQHPAPLASTGTVDNRPAFPTPVTNTGTNQSSQPPAAPSPQLHPTVDNGGGGTGNGGALQVQIISIPSIVPNNSKVHVVVQTNQPGITVRLQVNYNTAPFIYASSSVPTDGNGNATLTWSIRVTMLRGNRAQAQVMVLANDQNGQFTNSSSVTVTIQ